MNGLGVSLGRQRVFFKESLKLVSIMFMLEQSIIREDIPLKRIRIQKHCSAHIEAHKLVDLI